MPTFDAIIQAARALPLADRIGLIRLLLDDADLERHLDEIGVGERGLTAWTESTRGEDWSEFYPSRLRQRKVG